MFLLSIFTLALSFTFAQAGVVRSPETSVLPIYNITRSYLLKFENLAIRANGQILTTTTFPNASVYQVDPFGVLPMARIYESPNITSATAIVEGRPDVFYVASGDVNLKDPIDTVPQSYSITEIDVRGVHVLANGTLSKQPFIKHIASLPDAALLNGAALSRRQSDHLLVADSFRGLIWNVNICDGSVGVTLNDSTTKGTTSTGPTFTGINGMKEHNGDLYWTNTGASTMYKVPIDENGYLPAGVSPSLITSNLTCDDFVVDDQGNAFVAGPLDVITKVSPEGDKQIIAGSFNSSTSDLIGPTAVKFGRTPADHDSLYVTTNGGLAIQVPGTAGISRIDLMSR